MKTSIIILMLIPLMGCEYYSNLKKYGTTDVVGIIKDETDTMIAFSRFETSKLLPSNLLSNSGFQSTNGLKIKFTSIKNVRLTDERIFNLNPSNGLMNQIERKSEIDSFKNNVNMYLRNRQRAYSTIGNSAVFEKISSELEWISKLNVDGKKCIIVFSDLRQNIPNHPLNMYKVESISILRTNPNSFDSIYISAYPLPNELSGITIKFIYQPASIEDDQIFLLIANRIKGLLEKRGAIVYISGSLSL